MKKRDAIQPVRRALTEHLRSGATKVGIVVPGRASEATPHRPGEEVRVPEFEFAGWQFFTIDGPFEDELTNDGGDAKLRAPDGTYLGVVWVASGTLGYRFDFTWTPMPMLYVDVPSPVSSWSELRPHFESLAPALEAELRRYAEQR